MGHPRQSGNRNRRKRVVKRIPKPKKLIGSIYGMDDKPTQQLVEIADDLLFRLENVSPDVYEIYVNELKITCDVLAPMITEGLDEEFVTQLLNDEFGKGVLLGIIMGQKAEQYIQEQQKAAEESEEEEGTSEDFN